jgi:type VI secretion system protein ImpC
VEGGGLVEGLPSWTSATDGGGIERKCPTEIAITERREKELSDLGFIPLLHGKGTDLAVFFSMQTCAKPGLYDNEDATANSRLSTQLQYVLTTSRFAHYLQSITRDWLGRFVSRSQCETFLNQWISNYVLPAGTESPSIVTKARYPLSEGRVDVVEHPDRPGLYRAIVFLRPHFQLDELSISMRLSFELPAAAAR